jgi:hypothetical protein
LALPPENPGWVLMYRRLDKRSLLLLKNKQFKKYDVKERGVKLEAGVEDLKQIG